MSEGLHEKSLEEVLREFETQLTNKSFNELTALGDKVLHKSENGPKSKRPTCLAKYKAVQNVIDSHSLDPNIVRQLDPHPVLRAENLSNFLIHLGDYLSNLPENIAEMTLGDLMKQYSELKEIKNRGKTFSSINFIQKN